MKFKFIERTLLVVVVLRWIAVVIIIASVGSMIAANGFEWENPFFPHKRSNCFWIKDSLEDPRIGVCGVRLVLLLDVQEYDALTSRWYTHWNARRYEVDLIPVALLSFLFIVGPNIYAYSLRERRRRNNECIKCGYSKKGAVSNRCPECGLLWS